MTKHNNKPKRKKKDEKNKEKKDSQETREKKNATQSNAHLIDVARRVVEDPEHGHEAVGRAVGAGHVRVGGPDAVDRHADAARELRDGCTLQREGGPQTAVIKRRLHIYVFL